MNAPFAYDLVDYPSLPHPQTHPSRLAPIARLHGLDAAAPSRCRVLDIGCSDGGNLFPLALAYPYSEFVGIDLSATAIARGERMRARLQLDNARLHVADLSAWDPGPRPYDYILAHGFYSWVPPFVREALLALCRDHLAPAGIAYISYNALPGCQLRRMMWNMLRFHVRGVDEPMQRVDRSVALLNFLEQGVLSRKVYSDVVREEARQLIHKTDPALLFHDDLSDTNDPLLFSDFMAQARGFGLEFVAEADYFESTEEVAPPETREQLRALAGGDVVLREQYLDFLKGRRFRQTLLCRADAPLRREAGLEVIAGFDAVGQVTAEPSPVNLDPGAVVQFSDPAGAGLSTDHPVVKAALAMVGEAFPAPLAFDALFAQARARAGRSEGAETEEDRDALLHALLLAFRLGLVVLHAQAPRFATQPDDRPRLGALARLQLEGGSEVVTSLRPSVVRLENPMTRELVRMLDGTRDRGAIVRDLAVRMAEDPALQAPGDEPHSIQWWRAHLVGQLESGLQQAARLALLLEPRA